MRGAALTILVGCGRLGFEPGGVADARFDARDLGPGGDALIAWYDMDSIAIDLQRGTMRDETGRMHDITCEPLSRCPGPVSGRHAGAFRFDGIEHELRTLDHADFRTTSGFTIAAWLKVGAYPEDHGCPVQKVFGTAMLNSWQICVRADGRPDVYTTNGSTYQHLAGPTTLELGVWHHVAISWDGSRKRIVVDADLASGIEAISIAFDAGDVVLGRDEDAGLAVSGFTGELDDVRIYNRALTMDELAAIVQ
jgi:hypothetical protein